MLDPSGEPENPDPVPFLDLKRETDAVRAELDAAAARVLDRGWFLLGPEQEAFESAFASYAGGAQAVGVASGLAALELILAAHDIGAGDEVIVPANTYIATWIAVTRAGAKPVPVEPDPRTRNIDPALVGAAVTERTRAIYAVHLYGEAADMMGLREVADAHDLRLFVDAAQSAGAEIGGSRAATLGDAAAFSFYPTKNLGALADAGAVVTDDVEIAQRVRLLRNYGMRDRVDHPEIGTNARMDEMTAAFLAAKLAHLDAWNARRAQIGTRYLAELSDLEDLALPAGGGCWHLFVVQCGARDALREHLSDTGVQTAIHYPVPPHLSGAYAGQASGTFPITEQLAATALSLPISAFHSDTEIARVCAAVRGFIER
jgi:dTDP-3-amino-3,4,6-trideoxy-alpha-D-glucose transaminase